VKDHFETFVWIYDVYFQGGTDSGDLIFSRLFTAISIAVTCTKGFARLKCKDCGNEYLLAFACKHRLKY